MRWLVVIAGIVLAAGLSLRALRPSPRPVADEAGEVRAAPSTEGPEPVVQPLEALARPSIGRVTGRAISGGRPVPGASVELFLSQCPWCAEGARSCFTPREVRALAAGLAAGTLFPAAAARTVTGPDGSFELTIPAGFGEVIVRGPTGAIGSRTFTAGEAGALDIELVEPVRTELRLQAGETPAAGLLVWVVDRWAHTTRRLRSDGAGRIITERTAGAPDVLIAEPGFVPELLTWVEDAAQVERATQLTVLTRSLGAPVDAEVQWTEGCDEGEPTRAMSVNGQLVVHDIPLEERFELSFVASADGQISAPASLLPGTSAVTLELWPAASLVVDVTDGAGQPVADPNVDLVGPVNSLGSGGAPSPVTIGPVPAGGYLLEVEGKGMLRSSRSIELPPGESRLSVILEPQVALEGLVKDSRGVPVPAAEVMIVGPGIEEQLSTDGTGAFRWQGPAIDRVRVLATSPEVGYGSVEASVPGRVELVLQSSGLDLTVEAPEAAEPSVLLTSPVVGTTSVQLEQGRATRADLAPGPWTVQVEADGLAPVEARVTLEAGRITPVRLTLGGGASVQGRVVDAQGAAVVGAAVRATSIIEGEPAALTRATSASDGRFQLTGFEAGTKLRLMVHTGEGLLGKPTLVTAPARGVVLTLAGPKRVRGTVSCGGGPAASFEVNGTPVEDPGGAFEIPMGADEDTVLVSAPPCAQKAIPVPESGDVGRVVLSRPRGIRGSVVDAEGKPSAGASVQALDGETRTALDGSFELPVDPGDDEPFEVAASQGLQRARVEVPAGARVQLVLSRPTTVRGVVRSARTGTGPLQLLAEDERGTRRGAITDDEGRYQLELWPGQWTFQSPGVAWRRTVEVAGPSMEVNLGGPPEGSCALVVSSPVPISAVSVTPRGAAGGLELFVPLQLSVALEGLPCGPASVGVGTRGTRVVSEVELTRTSRLEVRPDGALPLLQIE